MRSRVAEHRGLAILLGIGFVVHLAAWVAYWPSLWYSDSVSYTDLAAHGGLSPTRQMAYPWFLRALIAIGGESKGVLATVTALQHLAALVAGALVYALLRRLDCSKALALVGTAVVVLDAFAISVDQTILSEGFYVLALTASFALLVLRPRLTAALVASGILLAAAVWLRSAGLFAIPPWLAYVIWQNRAARPTFAAVTALIVPLLVYCTIYWAGTGVFGFTQTSGWFMYGRVAEIANCRTAAIPKGTARLCPRGKRPVGAAWYIWDWHSPAWKLYGRNPGGRPQRLEQFDARLRSFAAAVIADRPGAYARLVLADLGRFFQPGLMKRGDNDDLTTTFGRYDPEHDLQPPSTRTAQRAFDSYRPKDRPPAALVVAYAKVVHLPRLPLAALMLCGLAGVLVRPLRRATRHPAEVALLLGAAFLVLLGHALTSDFAVRYLLPVVPLIVAGGIPGSRWLLVAATRGRGIDVSEAD